MSVIYYNLNAATSLQPFVSGPAPGGGWGAATNHMPAVSGIYLIWNTHTNNGYVGIAANLNNRFGGRHEAAVHLGIDQAYMAGILVWYGTVSVYDTPVPPPPLAPPPPPPPVLALNGGLPVPAGNIGALSAVVNNTPYFAQADGVGINLEHLLIRFYIAGGMITYNTNTMLVGNWVNNTGNPVHVYVNYAGINTLPPGYWSQTVAPLAVL